MRIFSRSAAVFLAACFAFSLGGCSDKKDDVKVPEIGFNEPAESEMASFRLVPADDDVSGDQFETAYEVLLLRLTDLGFNDRNLAKDEDEMVFHLSLPVNEVNDEVLGFLTAKADLTFRKGDSIGDDGMPDGEIILDGSDVESAEIVYIPEEGYGYRVDLTLRQKGKDRFAAATAELAGKKTPIAIWLDGELLSAPMVSAPIYNGCVAVTGNFTGETAKKLADQINSGMLPFEVRVEK